MGKIILLLVMCLTLSGCFGASVSGYGVFKIDPGVRIYKSTDTILIHITYKEGEQPPSYKEITPLLKGVFK